MKEYNSLLRILKNYESYDDQELSTQASTVMTS